jgi:HlyD family secretion protein
MDRARTPRKALKVKRLAVITTLSLTVVGTGAALASIDFSSYRVDRDTLSIETVQQGAMEVKVSANGQLLARNIEQLASQVSGRVVTTHVKPGAVVQEGQVLVELSNPQLLAAAEEAQSAWEEGVAGLRAYEAELEANVLNREDAVNQAEANLKKMRMELDAQSRLFGQHIVSELEYKRTQLNVALAEKTYSIEQSRLEKVRNNVKVQLEARRSRVSQLERALERARTEVANLQIVAGMNGIVQAISVEVGQHLQPGSPVGHIAQHEQLYAELKVPAREAAGVQDGQKVVVDTRRGTVDGVVVRVDPGVTEGNVVVDVELQGELPSGARPQLQVEGVIYLTQLPSTLFVGRPAYVKADSEMVVYKLDPAGRYASPVTIRAGKVSLNHLQVLQGLSAGDRIITSETGEWQNRDRILLN